MAIRKTKSSLIEIPTNLRVKVEDMVKSGLYSNEMEFVNDAVRRLIIRNKQEEIMSIKCKDANKEKGSLGDERLEFPKQPPS